MEHREHHELVEIGALTGDTRLFAHHGVCTIAPNHVIRFERLARAVSRLVDHAESDSPLVMFDHVCCPAESHLNARQACHALSQYVLETVLRHAIVLLKIILPDDLAALKAVPMLVRQAAIGDDTGSRHFGRQEALSTHLLDATPEIEVLESPLRQVLSL